MQYEQLYQDMLDLENYWMLTIFRDFAINFSEKRDKWNKTQIPNPVR